MPTTLERTQYGFDRASRRIWQKRTLTDTQDQQYNYDALSQVSAAARGSLNLNKTALSGVPASAQSWDYDPTGNWRGYHAATNGTAMLDQHRVHDRGNRLTQIEDNPHNMILDRVGRMRQMAPDASGDWDGKLEVTWDAWSRITRVKNNGTVVGEYAYDGTHRRTTREVDGETLHSYYNDAWRPVEERRVAETTAAISYLWGARHRDDLVRRDRATSGTTLNESRYVLMDYFNPAAVTDEAGAVKERYAFSAFGVRAILNPDFTVRSASECGMEFGFQGQFLDTESGLMNYGYRYYSPQLGRWTCKDPVNEDGGLNLYCMCGNASIDRVDHLGLLAPSDQDVCDCLELRITLKRWGPLGNGVGTANIIDVKNGGSIPPVGGKSDLEPEAHTDWIDSEWCGCIKYEWEESGSNYYNSIRFRYKRDGKDVPLESGKNYRAAAGAGQMGIRINPASSSTGFSGGPSTHDFWPKPGAKIMTFYLDVGRLEPCKEISIKVDANAPQPPKPPFKWGDLF